MTIGIEIVLIALGVGLAGGGYGGYKLANSSAKKDIAAAEAQARAAEAQARQAEAAAAATVAAGDLVKEATASYLAQTELTAEVTSAVRARWLCEDSYKAVDPVPCTVFLLCAQAAGGSVQATACDALVNQWISERQLKLVEEGDAEAPLRDERRRQFEKRK